MAAKSKWSGNKGEWSEAYAFLKLAGEGRIHLPDGQYQVIDAFVRDNGNDTTIDYLIDADKGEVVWVVDEQNHRMAQSRFSDEAELLLEAILSSKGTFTVHSTVEFYEELGINRLKPSTSKADLVIDIHDPKTCQSSEYGWSVKSLIGSRPTLMNASGATKICYELGNMTDQVMEYVNSIGTDANPTPEGKYKARVKYLIEHNHLETSGIPIDRTFEHNLKMVDSSMPEFIGELLKLYYSSNRLNSSTALMERLEAEDPLHYGSDYEGIYTYKWCQLLVAVALGMEPSRHWDGSVDATGGFIVIMKDGKINAATTYDRTGFEKYLLESTSLDTPSGSRHGFGSVYKKSDDTYAIDLALQIRYSQ